ncbi:MAG: hypothetical protein M3N37_04400 [Actinomycetota bacterium]|nr:hypothetical protein [Actinomycetota bacterium]
MEGGRLTQEQIAKVLRRAAELDRTPDDDPRLEAAAVEAAAVEAGLSPTSVSQALAELQVGALEPVLPARVGLLGPPSLTVQRAVPGPRSAVDTAVRAWLSGQLFEQRRQFGDRERWTPREGVLASVRRGLDLNHRISLNGVRSLEFALAASPAGDRKVLVCFHADVREQRTAHAWWMAGGAVAGTGTAGALFLVDPITGLASLPLGAGMAFGGHLAGRSYYRREVSKIETALAGLLDRLEHRPRSAASALPTG